jgi:predicted membrane protein
VPVRGGISMEIIRLFFENLYDLISVGIDFLLSLVIRMIGWPILHVMKGLSQTHGLERICYFLAFISLCALFLTAFYYFWVYFVPILIFFVPLLSVLMKGLLTIAAIVILYLMLKKQCLKIVRKNKNKIKV